MLCDFPVRSVYRRSPEREPPVKRVSLCVLNLKRRGYKEVIKGGNEKMKRKLLSVLMALCLILTLLPTAVFAEELTPPEESGEQQEEQIKEPSTPEKEPDDPEKEQEGEEDLQPSDGDPELPAGDGEDERDPQTPETVYRTPPGRKSLKMAAPLCRMRCRFGDHSSGGVRRYHGTERRDDGI